MVAVWLSSVVKTLPGVWVISRASFALFDAAIFWFASLFRWLLLLLLILLLTPPLIKALLAWIALAGTNVMVIEWGSLGSTSIDCETGTFFCFENIMIRVKRRKTNKRNMKIISKMNRHSANCESMLESEREGNCVQTDEPEGNKGVNIRRPLLIGSKWRNVSESNDTKISHFEIWF